jgi:hypothetical protein
LAVEIQIENLCHLFRAKGNSGNGGGWRQSHDLHSRNGRLQVRYMHLSYCSCTHYHLYQFWHTKNTIMLPWLDFTQSDFKVWLGFTVDLTWLDLTWA